MNQARLRIRSASVPKPGEDPGDNEDRVDWLGCRIALSDGASRSARPEVWADLLVSSFVHGGGDPLDPEQIKVLRDRWRASVFSDDLPGYAVSKLAEGGAATFLGLQIDPASRTYHVRAVGDTCLLHVRNGTILVAGPLEHPDAFSCYPALISTLPGVYDHEQTAWEHYGAFESDDALVLATDAAAAFLLGANTELCQELIATGVLDDEIDFADWVRYARAEGMASDDTTVCVVRL
ncbi:hypothetical protein J2W56_006608 [Nocardia kruczakiae]|uniref:Protein phosphatase 2C-like protein n=1 Tax=Nocardia kruczakiae TaxID=261477 RepID=A0ABU1XSA3_9NOCA|nr:hypothetical protein [Nocardia kruczakiae]MDR7172842.1 hypothetical protein [Nocardia kruczakiae]